MRIVAGVDCHKDSHTIVVINGVGEVLSELTIPTTREGYAEAIERVRAYGTVEWGLEGTGSYGRALADALLLTNAVVYEVPGSFTKRHRRHASRRGKSDPLDARAIAEAVLREADRLPRCEQCDDQEAVRLRYDRRDRLVRQRTESVNRLRDAAMRLTLAPLPSRVTAEGVLLRITELLADHRGKNDTSDALVEEIDEAISDIRRLNTAIAQLERQLRPFVKRLAPELLTLHGVSTVVAAGLIGHAGNLRTCRNASAFAMRAGTAPVPCSSGRNSSVRVNTGGDRQLNRLLHVISLVQKRTPNHPGQLYYARKRAEGKTHRAAMRSHKRQLATVVFYRLGPLRERLLQSDYSSAA